MSTIRLHRESATLPSDAIDAEPSTSKDAEPVAPNLVGLNLVRALAALAVVLLHACVPYVAHPMPGLVWSVMDSTSSVLDYVFWPIEMVIMPVFLVMAGLLAYRTYSSKGEVTLVRSRAKRLLRPLLFAAIVILPLDLYIWVFSWVCEGIVAPVKLKSLKFDGVIDRDLWGFGHLWFLHYLLSYVAVFAGLATLKKRFVSSDAVSRLFARSIGIALLCVPLFCVAAITIYFRPEVIWGFQHAFAPVPSKWIYNAVFFALGVLIARSDLGISQVRDLHPRWAGVTACVMMATLLLGLWSLDQTSGGQTLDGDELSRASSALLAIGTAASSLMGSVMVLSMALRFSGTLPRSIEYLAAASFWVYLVHHPILGLIHLDLKWWLPGALPVVKALAATVVAMAFSLLTYEAVIRKSSLGAWLGMNWSPERSEAARDANRETILPMPSRGETPTRRAA